MLRTARQRSGDNAEFGWPEIMAFPAEVLACLRVREALGLANPPVDHHFLRTPSANVRPRAHGPTTRCCGVATPGCSRCDLAFARSRHFTTLTLTRCVLTRSSGLAPLWRWNHWPWKVMSISVSGTASGTLEEPDAEVTVRIVPRNRGRRGGRR